MTTTTPTKGIPTRYAGHLFRSRLEARWAAMFDLLGWSWTYEPFDCNGYIPDFVIEGPKPLLVEVKPDTTYKELETRRHDMEPKISGRWSHDYLIVGSSPTHGAYEPIGMLGEFLDDDHPYVKVGKQLDPNDPDLDIPKPGTWISVDGAWIQCDVCGSTSIGAGYPSQVEVCGHKTKGTHIPDRTIRALWGEAHEATRWTPR